MIIYMWLTMFLTTNNPVGRDVLDGSNSRFRGSMESIAKWIQGFDYLFQCFVTFVGFGIICAAIGKNCLAGLYCTFPKFFDKVDAAHKEHENEGWVDQIRGLKSSYNQINGHTIGKFLLRLVPNVKSITDFEDSSVSAKDYFFKAVPLMCVAVIIGGFIYNGFHADVGAKITDFGSELFYRTIMATDPIEVFDKVTNSINRPTFASDGSDLPEDSMITDISNSAWASIKSRWSDIHGKTTVATIGSNIENWVSTSVKTQQASGSVYEILSQNPEGWKYETDVKIVESDLDLSNYQKTSKVNDTEVRMFADKTDIMDGPIGLRAFTAKDDEETHYLVYIVKLTKISEKVKKGACYDIALTASFDVKNNNVTIKLSDCVLDSSSTGSWAYTDGASVTITGSDGSTTGKFSKAEATITVSKDDLAKICGLTSTATKSKFKDKKLTIGNLAWQQGATKSTVKVVTLGDSIKWSSETYTIGSKPGELDTFTQKTKSKK